MVQIVLTKANESINVPVQANKFFVFVPCPGLTLAKTFAVEGKIEENLNNLG